MALFAGNQCAFYGRKEQLESFGQPTQKHGRKLYPAFAPICV